MRILIVGSGGREHALAWKLAQEAEVHASPGNPGIAECAQCHLASPSIADLAALAKNLSPDLVVVGPEAPLIAGLADSLRTHEIPTFGVDAAGAQLEGSKAFSKELMRAAGVLRHGTLRCPTLTRRGSSPDRVISKEGSSL